mmetsp:Transcript_18337/g.35902  ORF Transcript_18337/g.35902 Transcript_18337/m.35902 type:complete len:227 (+) Transcript_18337:3246-3926(+)
MLTVSVFFSFSSSALATSRCLMVSYRPATWLLPTCNSPSMVVIFSCSLPLSTSSCALRFMYLATSSIVSFRFFCSCSISASTCCVCSFCFSNSEKRFILSSSVATYLPSASSLRYSACACSLTALSAWSALTSLSCLTLSSSCFIEATRFVCSAFSPLSWWTVWDSLCSLLASGHSEWRSFNFFSSPFRNSFSSQNSFMRSTALILACSLSCDCVSSLSARAFSVW